MNAQGLFSIGGIASGLDTDDIVNQLMQLERQPINRLEQRRQTLQTTRDAWGQINTRLSSLRTATDQLRRPDRLTNLATLSSSDPDAVAVTRSGGAVEDTQLSFVVQQLATAMQRTSSDAFASRDAALDGRQLTITGSGGTFTSDLGPDATLDDLVGAINAADIGVRAMVLPVGGGQHQLVLDATEAGIPGGFSVDDATGWDGSFGISQAAQNAQIRVGGVVSEWESNTIDGLVKGATIELRRTTDTAVTVRSERDVDAAVGAVKDFVDAINNVITTIGELTAYDPETRSAAPLQGQFAATQLAFDLRSALTAPVAGLTGADALASSVGIRSHRDGTVSLDEARLREAFTNDFDATARRFSRSGTSDGAAAVAAVSGGRETQPGSYDVTVTQAAGIARAVGGVYSPPTGQPKAFTVIGPNGRAVTVRIDTDQTTAVQAAAKIQQALDEAEITNLVAETVGERLSLSSTSFGSATSFTVQEVEVDADGEIVLDGDGSPVVIEGGGSVFGLEGTHAGVDVAGTIDGVEATGRGRTLSVSDGPAAGLAVTTVAGLDLGSEGPRAFEVSFWQGIGGVMDAALARAEGSRGSVARARASLDSQMGLFESRIEQFEQRLQSREVTLRRQFVGLETAIAQFNAQSQWLDGQINQLNALTAQRSARR